MAERKIRKAGEGTLSTLQDGRIRLRVTDGNKIITDKKTGQQKKILNRKDFIGHSEQEVFAKYEKWKKAKEEGRDLKFESRPLLECIYEWLRNVKEGTIKESSYSRLIQVTDTYILPRFNVYTVGEVKPDVIQTVLIDDLKRKGYSYSTIKKATNVLTGFYTWAFNMDKLKYNPTKALTLPNDKVIKEKKGQLSEIKYYSKSEIRKMKKTADETNDNCYEVNKYRFPRAYVYLFIMYTGLRIGEMLALRWDDYNPEKKTITIRRDVVEYKDPNTKKIITKVQNTPKTSSSRRVLVLNDSAIHALEEIKKRSFNADSEYIVANRNKNQKRDGAKEYVAPSNFRNAFKRFCEAAGVEYKGLHALRHTFATIMFDKGIDIKYISDWLGHSSVQVTYDIYVHVMEEYGVDNKTAIPAFDI